MNLTTEQVLAIGLAIIAAPGFWKILELIFTPIINFVTGIQKISNEQLGAMIHTQGKKIDALETAFETQRVEEAEKDAKAARRRILRADDELRIGIKHSKDFFEDILRDIDSYEEFCDSHPHFKNRVAESAIQNVSDTYNRCKAQNDFL